MHNMALDCVMLNRDSSTVIDHCRGRYQSNSTRQQSVGVAWVYCSYSNQNAQTIDRLIASIIKQLVASPSREIGEKLMKKVNKFGQDHKGGSPSLDDYQSLLSDIAGTLERSVVIIDALDECTEIDSNGYSREWMVEMLLGLDIQLLVTSRDLPLIQGLFNDAQSFAKISITPNLEDIESYIKWRIFDSKYGSPKKLRDVIRNHPLLLAEITRAVSKKYSQM